MIMYLAFVFIHILSAIIWLGGLIFMSFVLMPVLRREEWRDQARLLLQHVSGKFRMLGHISLGLLLITGLHLMHSRGFFTAPELWKTPMGHTMGGKILGWVLIMVLSFIHDKRIGKKAMEIWQKAPGSPEATSLRRTAMVIGRVNLLISLAVVAMGVVLVRGVPV